MISLVQRGITIFNIRRLVTYLSTYLRNLTFFVLFSAEYTNLSDSDPALSEGKLYIDSDKKKDHYVAEPALQLDGSTMREYALQVALGMRHLEERGITHR